MKTIQEIERDDLTTPAIETPKWTWLVFNPHDESTFNTVTRMLEALRKIGIHGGLIDRSFCEADDLLVYLSSGELNQSEYREVVRDFWRTCYGEA